VEEVPLREAEGVEVLPQEVEVVVVLSCQGVVVEVEAHPQEEEVEGEAHLLMEVVEEVEVRQMMEEGVEVEHQVVVVVEDLLLSMVEEVEVEHLKH